LGYWAVDGRRLGSAGFEVVAIVREAACGQSNPVRESKEKEVRGAEGG